MRLQWHRGACHNGSWSHPYEMSLIEPELGIDKFQDRYQVEGKAEFRAKLSPLGELLSDYYEYREWNEDGIPLPKKLRGLGL